MEARKGKRSFNPFQYVTQIFKIAILSAIFLCTISFISHFKLAHYFPIKTVRVYGVNKVDHQEVQDALTPLVDRGFFSINVDVIKDRLLQLPWVSDTVVRRDWPDEVDVTFVERNAIARWGDQSLLSETGELFYPKQESYPDNLPHFIGPEGTQVSMLQYFNQINRILVPLHVKISYLELTPYSTWKLKLDSGILLQIGHKDILTRLDHFVKVYPKIVGDRTADVEYVDLRYSNGVAIRWKTPEKT